MQNKHGRVGVKRTRYTTNQQLRQRCAQLERAVRTPKAMGTVPVQRVAPLWLALVEVQRMTEKSKTGVAKHVREYVTEVLEANA